MRHHHIPALTLTAWLLLGALSPSEAAAQVNVVLSCPPYNAATGEGNNPAMPQDPQVTPMDVSGAKPILCQVLYGNTSGAPLNNVRFTLRAAALAIPYAPTVALPGGDPMLAAAHPMDNAFVRTFMAPELNLAQAGFPTGTWSAAAGTYTWNIASIPAGQTGELRVGAVETPIAGGARYNVVLEVQVGANQPFTRSAPFELPASRLNMTPPVINVPQETGRPGSSSAGNLTGSVTFSHNVVVNGSVRPQDYDQELVVYLPWLDNSSGTLRNDGFSSANPQHRRIHDAAQLKAQATLRTYDGQRPEDLAFYGFGPGQSSAPQSGSNAGRVLRYDAATNTLRLRFGRLGITPPVVSWRAPLLDIVLPAGVTSLPTRVCHRSQNTQAAFPAQPERCSVANAPLVATEASAPFSFQGDINAGRYHSESDPLLPYSPFTMRFGGSYNASRPATNVSIYMQMPGDTQRRARFIAARSFAGIHNLFPEVRPFAAADAIYVSTQPSAYGSEDNLIGRTMPSPTAIWRRCDDAIAGQPAGVKCEAAHLQAIGVNPADVTEVRFDVAELDGYTAFGRPTFDVQGQLDGTARSSINGRTSPGNTDMRDASVGAKFTLAGTTPGGFVGGGVLTGNWAEVQGGSVLSYFNLQPINGVQTTEARASWEVQFRNRGPGAVEGPIILKMRFPPVGYEIDNTNRFPGEPYRPRVRKAFHMNQTAANEAFTIGDVPTSDYTSSWDAATRELTVTLTLASTGGQLVGNTEPGLRTLGAPYDLFVEVDGFVRIGAPRLMQLEAVSLEASVVRPSGTRARETIMPPYLPRMNVTSVAPALSLSGVAAPDPVPGYGAVTADYTLSNAAYQANGTRLANGATGSARGVALYHQVTRDGDFGLTGRATFESASSADAGAIFVRATEPMMGQKGDASSLTSGNGWVFCSMAGMPCDASALMAAGLMPAQVRWVAFDMGELLVTDAQPRGVAPRGGAMRMERPYTAQVVVRDAGSPQGAILRARGEVLSQDTVSTSTAEMELDVVVNAACDLRDPAIGVGRPELCDGKDNDCDGQLDEGFADLGTTCSAGLGACRNEAQVVCAADGMGTRCPAVAGEPSGPEVCDGMDNTCDDVVDEGFDGLMASCMVDGGGGCMVEGAGACAADGRSVICAPLNPSDMDDDGYLDVCDCAPGDDARWTTGPGAGSCDEDQDGACDGMIVAPNAALCLVTGDCDDADGGRAPGRAELCDGVDQDCDGQEDEDFVALGLGSACEVGVGACNAAGVFVCAGDGVACDAVAGAPADEVCDEVDNDCDGAVDEGGESSAGSVCEPVPEPLPPAVTTSGDGLVSCSSAPAGRAAPWSGLLWLSGLVVGLWRLRRRA